MSAPRVLCPRAGGFITLGRCTLEVLEWLAQRAGAPGCGSCVCNPVLDQEGAEPAAEPRADDPG